jgi:hypothetical protein
MKNDMSWPAKPAKFYKKQEREFLKTVYHQQRYEDRAIGKKIDVLFSQFHKEMKKEIKDRNVDVLKSIVSQLSELRQQKTFRKEFPTFSSFKKFVKKEKITVEDLLVNI